MTEPKPGTIFVVSTTGWAARAIQIFTLSRVNHTGIYAGNGLVYEATPDRGFVLSAASNYPNAIWLHTYPLTDAQGLLVVACCKRLIGRRYNFVDIVALGLNNWGIHPAWVRKRLADTSRLICSQAVDYAYQLAGIHLFSDGRTPGAVSPGDIAELAFEGAES